MTATAAGSWATLSESRSCLNRRRRRRRRRRFTATMARRELPPPRRNTYAALSEIMEAHDIDDDAKQLLSDDRLKGTVCVVDMRSTDQEIIYVNTAFSILTGYASEECVGRNCRFLQGPCTKPEDVEAIRKLLRSHDEGFIKITNVRKDGRLFSNVLYLKPLFVNGRKPGDKPLFYLGCQSDCSDPEPKLGASAPLPVGASAGAGAAGAAGTASSGVSGGAGAALAAAAAAAAAAAVTAPVASYGAAVSAKTWSASSVKLVDRTPTPLCARGVHPNGDPMPFETDLFKGAVLLRTRTEPRCHPYFDGKRRQFEFQVQGQFKQQPKGTVWFGAEVLRPMSLGPIKKALCSVLLKFVSAYGRGVHASFGEADGMCPPSVELLLCPPCPVCGRACGLR